MRHIALNASSVEYATNLVEYATNLVEYMNKLCLLEWELTRRSRSAENGRLNQISRTYSFESTENSI